MPTHTTAFARAVDDAMAVKQAATPSPWRSVEALAERINSGAANPTMTPHAIRHHIRNADSNGLAPHVRRIGRKILINEPGFLDWLSQR
jgi:hypothetical protein